jgi:DNA-binding NarL/FixJ family response regulator
MTATIDDYSSRIGRKAVLPVWSADGGVVYGRDAERRAVGELLRRARRGAGGVVLVEGEQGIGKSRLLGESVSEAAGQGFSLAAGAADRLGWTIPFFASRAALRADLERRAAVAPVLVSLDDLQWASPAMLAALRSLPGELKGHPIAWILARSSARHEDAGLLFSVLERDGATRITLGPLGGDAVASLLTDAFGAPPGPDLLALSSGAAGNPLLLTELVGGLRDDDAVRVTGGHAGLISPDLPQRIVGAVHQRLESLSGRARHLLATAAVLGSSFRLEDAADMLAQAPATLLPVVQEAMGAGMVTPADDAFAFRHALVRRAVAEMIPQPARKALHRQYAQILLDRGGPAALAAGHLLQAAHSGDPASLAGLDQTAAQILPSSPQTAADLAARALELTPPGDPGALPRLVAAAEALAAAGRVGQAARIARDALARPLPAVEEARLRCVLAWVLCTSGRAQDACAEAGLVLARPQLPGDLRDQAIIAQLRALAGMPAEPTAGRLAGTVLASPRDHGDQVIAAAHITRAMISWDKGRISQALESLRDAARSGTGVSADARHAQPLLALAATLVDLRRIDQADGILRAAGHDKLQGIASEAVPPILRARMHLAAGRLADAAVEAEAALATAQTLAAHGHAWIARSVLGMIALRRGDLAAAARHIASRPAPMPHFAGIYARAETTLAQAQITEARTGPVAALGLVRDICAGLPTHRGLLATEPAAAAWLIRVARAAGDEELAAAVARAAEVLAGDNPGFGTLATAAAHALGLAHRDPARLAQAAAQHEDTWARASAAEDLGVLLASKADKDQAVRRLTEALDGYAQAGATADMARIRHRLRKLGVCRRHRGPSAVRPVSGWASLTDTECAASQLVAQGLNNQQIANRMYISVHTVACHLRQVFRKLNIGSRVELALIVIEQGLGDY